MSGPFKTPFTQEELCRALEYGEFVPYFQPLVDLRSGEIHGFEILARWEHPTRGLIPPDLFISLLQRFSLMNNLTAALLIPAFAVTRGLPGRFGLSVNFSPTQLHDRSLPALLEIMADEAQFDLTRLTVELTETALVDDLDLAGKSPKTSSSEASVWPSMTSAPDTPAFFTCSHSRSMNSRWTRALSVRSPSRVRAARSPPL